jgi:dolichol-phosphate mannosyltransferase
MAGSPPSHLISVVVPTLNEADNVEPLVLRIMEVSPSCGEIVIVDDGSTDGTRQRVRSLAAVHPVRLIERDQPTLGLSGAVIAGARAARHDSVVVMDADLSHPPSEIENLAAPLLNGTADMVIGSRYVTGGTTPGWPLYRRIMSRAAAGMAYPLTGAHDSMGGFFAIRRATLLELAPAATGFKIAFEAMVRGGRGLRVLEVPITFRDRTRGASKMNLRVALLFSFRWFVAASRVVFRKRTAAPRGGDSPQV